MPVPRFVSSEDNLRPILVKVDRRDGRVPIVGDADGGPDKARLLRVAASRDMNDECHAAAAETAANVVDAINAESAMVKL